jgi:uncharacterized cofD-like protein
MIFLIKPMKKVVTIGGGTGSYTVLRGLKHFDDILISAIVSMADDGGSTGALRDELGVLPPGDVRQCLVALSLHDEVVRKLMKYRFEEGSLKGHNFGNILLAGLEKTAGSFVKGIEIASDILKIKGRVIPVTEDVANLLVVLKDGTELLGQNNINHSDIQSVGVKEVLFQGAVEINELAKKAIVEADLIVLGPGNFYCSLMPNFIVDGFKEAIEESKAKIVVPVNLTNKKGHTLFFNASDYVREIESMIGRKVDYVICNNETPSDEQIEMYKVKEGDGVLVANDMTDDKRVILAPVLSHEIFTTSEYDSVANARSFIRHDSKKLAEALHNLV